MSSHPDVDMVQLHRLDPGWNGGCGCGSADRQARGAGIGRQGRPISSWPSADLAAAVKAGVEGVLWQHRAILWMRRPGCFVPRVTHDEALAHAAEAAAAVVVGDPTDTGTTMGPLISKAQYDKVQRLIQAGIDEGATLVCGGTEPSLGPQPRLVRPADDLRRRDQ